MKTKLFLTTIFALGVSLLTGLTVSFGEGAPAKLRYQVVDLGAENAIGNEINDRRQVVGSKDVGDGRHAAFWPNLHSTAIDLGTLPEALGSRGTGINVKGEMVGFSGGVPVFWANSQNGPLQLAGLPEDAGGYASDINCAGQIAGQVFDDIGVSPIFWASSNVPATYLPLAGDQFPNGAAFSVNDAGNLFGDACDGDFIECHGAFWANSTSTPVLLASPDNEFIYTDVGLSSDFSFAHAMNNAGSMVGFAVNPDTGETRAVSWARSTSPAVILSTTDDFANGTAEAINDNGQIVGTAYNGDFSNMHAFFWPSAKSPGIDLNAVIPPNSGWEVVIARSINNRGEITGAAFLDGDEAQHAIVLVPLRHGSNRGVH